jgi:hypothetical protein
MNLEKTVDNIVNKLLQSNIMNIVSIDNDWSVNDTQEDITTDLQEYLKIKSIQISKDEKRQIDNDDIIAIEDLLKSSNEELYSLKEKVKAQIYKQGKIPETLLSLEVLLDKISEKIENINIEKFSEHHIDFGKFKGNTLFILDKKMSNSDSDIIVDSILEINKDNKDGNDIILIYSSESIDDYKTNESKLNYLQRKLGEKNSREKELLIYNMWAIGKSGIIDELALKVYEMLTDSIYGNSLYNVFINKLVADEESFKKLIRIDTKDLSDLFKDSFVEGDNITQYMDRLYCTLKNEHELNSMNHSYMKSIESLVQYEREKIDNIVSDIDSYRKFRDKQIETKLKRCRTNNSHYSIVDYSVNKYYFDLSTGDLFKLKTSEEHSYIAMLISQSCDCVIRIPDKDIKEVERKTSKMQLLLFTFENIEENYSSNNLKNVHKGIWPININNNMSIIYPTAEIISIDSHVLDLCTLNSNGIANIDYEEENIKKYKQYHSCRFFQEFKKKHFGEEFEKLKNSISLEYTNFYKKLFEDVKSEVACDRECNFSSQPRTEEDEIKRIVGDKVISLKYNISFSDNKFELERIGRLELQRTLFYIQEYVYMLAKVGIQPVP